MSKTAVTEHIRNAFQQLILAGSREPNKQIFTLWQQIFGHDSLECMRAITSLSRDCDRARSIIKKAEMEDEEKNAFFSSLDQITIFLNPLNFHVPYINYQQNLTQNQVGIVGMASYAVKQYSPEGIVDEVELAGLIEELENILTDIEHTNFPDELGNILRNQLFYLLTCLKAIKIWGLQAACDALAVGMLTLTRTQIYIGNNSGDGQEKFQQKSLLDRIKSFFVGAHKVVQTADQAAKLTRDGIDFYNSLGNGGPPNLLT